MDRTSTLFSQLGTTLVTGGAGFIGSHVVDQLVAGGVQVKVLDNLSAGHLSNLASCDGKKNFCFIKNDLNESENLEDTLTDVENVLHFAADPEVRSGYEHPEISFNENIRNTFTLLEKIRRSNVKTILFTSSSTVYGEPDMIPTSEEYGPLVPISPYGASKLACEALVLSYCHTYGIRGQIFRLANIIGSRTRHGVIWDFMNKLRKDKHKLEVLGDGKQTKSYLHVNDSIACFFYCLLKSKKCIDIFNIGNDDRIDVMSIAQTICKKMNLNDVEIITTGGVDGGRGWVGDVKKMQLDISKLKSLGWNPQLSSQEAVELTSKELLKKPQV